MPRFLQIDGRAGSALDLQDADWQQSVEIEWFVCWLERDIAKQGVEVALQIHGFDKPVEMVDSLLR